MRASYNHDDIRAALPTATECQAAYSVAYLEHGTVRAVAELMGVNQSAVSSAIGTMLRRAALRGISPAHDMTKPCPDGFLVKGTSTYYGKNGEQRGQWVKTAADNERRLEIFQEFIRSLWDGKKPGPIIDAPPNRSDEILNIIPIGDPHIGMLAWAKETGEAFDLKIARELSLAAVDRLMQVSPDTDTCILLPLGDVFHTNDQTNRTPGHGHQLDADCRYVKILGVGIEIYKHMIVRALEKHPKVIVRFVRGNHDKESIWALAFTINAFFADNPRVTVDLSPHDFWYHRFGKVLIGSVHGDNLKHERLPGVMANDRPVDWGVTKHRYWYTGHLHKSMVDEFPGVVCETFRTLAALDAYASGHGYRSGRDMVCITHHREDGEIERHRCDKGYLERNMPETKSRFD